MKKLFVALMTASMLFVLFSCTDSANKTPADSSITLNTEGRTKGGSDDTELRWTDCEIATIAFTQGSDGFVLSSDVDITFSQDKSRTITAYTGDDDETGTQLGSDEVDLKLTVGGSEGSWTLKSNITGLTDTNLDGYTKYVLAINDSALTFTYTPSDDDGEPVVIMSALYTNYERVMKADDEPQGGETTPTTLTIASKGSGGSQESLKWTDVNIATIAVEPGDDGFVMSKDVTVTLSGDDKWTITTYIDNYAGSADDGFNTDDVELTLSIGYSDDTWVLKSTLTDTENDSGPISRNTTTHSYKLTINDDNVTFVDGQGHTVTASANIEYTQKSDGAT